MKPYQISGQAKFLDIPTIQYIMLVVSAFVNVGALLYNCVSPHPTLQYDNFGQIN